MHAPDTPHAEHDPVLKHENFETLYAEARKLLQRVLPSDMSTNIAVMEDFQLEINGSMVPFVVRLTDHTKYLSNMIYVQINPTRTLYSTRWHFALYEHGQLVSGGAAVVHAGTQAWQQEHARSPEIAKIAAVYLASQNKESHVPQM